MEAKRIVVMIALSALVLVGCGGGGGGGGSSTSSTTSSSSASPLSVASKVSVVEGSSSTGGKPSQEVSPFSIGTFKLTAAPSFPADSDYNKDKTEIYVHERSAKAFDIINEILCMLDQTGYDKASLLNKGPYKAQIDLNQCDSGNDNASKQGKKSQNQSSGSDAPDYETWTIDSSRADGSSPHIVKLWIHLEAEENKPAQTINAKMTITEGKSATNPYGLFEAQFRAVSLSNQELFKGFLKSTKDSNGKVLLQFFGNAADNSFLKRVTLNRASDGLSGGGTVYNKGGSGIQAHEDQFDIAFNTTLFTRKDTLPTSATFNTQTCLSRTEFSESAWRYGCYDATGKRVNRNSGFPIRFQQGTKNYHGWVGYWGIWMPDKVTLNNGDTVYKQTFGSGGATEEAMTVLISNGKLVKHTKRTLTLGDIKGIPLHYHDHATMPPGQFRVVWNGTAFSKIEKLNTTSFIWEKLNPAQSFSLSSLTFCDLHFWSHALRGSVRVKLTACTPTSPGVFSGSASDSSLVVSYREDMVYPTDTIPATLACFDRCPDPAKFSTADPFTNPSMFQPVAPSSATYSSYTFDTAGMVLKKSGTAVVLTAANSSFQWGIRSGALFEPTSANLAMLACEHDSTGNSTCGWRAWNAFDVFYTWETGTNNWNRFTALKKSDNTIIKFDPPLQLQYTHTGNGYTNAKFYLDYAGFGQLHGIPGKCVNFDTGEDADCGSNARWIPQFTIPEGSSVTDPAGTTYYVKALEKEQRMTVKTVLTCAALTLVSYTLPEISGYSDPNIGSEPTVANAPAVIGGLLQS